MLILGRPGHSTTQHVVVIPTDDRRKDHKVNYSFAASKFNPAKRVCFCSGSSEGAAQAELLEQVLGSIRDAMEDVSEFIMFLNSCPRLHRQPYNMYLQLDKCMFGRQMETEVVMNFLLQAETTKYLPVLPIVGPGNVGKSTLIEHVCDDKTVRYRFSEILFFNGELKRWRQNQASKPWDGWCKDIDYH